MLGLPLHSDRDVDDFEESSNLQVVHPGPATPPW
jgi:hypothetical protein